jgi:hypothetical protein
VRVTQQRHGERHHHIVLDFGATRSRARRPVDRHPAPGVDADGSRISRASTRWRARATASARLQQRRVTVKRVAADYDGRPVARRVLALPVRPRQGRHGAGDRAVRQHVPHAEPSGRAPADDLHGHRLGTDARDDRASPPAARAGDGRPDAVLRCAHGARAAVLRAADELPKDFIDINLAYSRTPARRAATCRTRCASGRGRRRAWSPIRSVRLRLRA